MHVLILYESSFGNTQKVAEAIGSAIENAADVTIREISTVDPTTFAMRDCLIIGAPTHGFRPPPATQSFLSKLPKNALKGKMIAAFDTRMALSFIKSGVLRFIVKRGGHASSTIEKKLIQKGGVPIIRRDGFCVTDKEGPLMDGEIERAKQWASNIKTWHTA